MTSISDNSFDEVSQGTPIPPYEECNEGKRRRLSLPDNIPEIGNIISFEDPSDNSTGLLGDLDDDNVEPGRCISCYGCRPIPPWESMFWIVTGMTHRIPHNKGSGIRKSQENSESENPEIHLLVNPVHRDESGGFIDSCDERSKVFWYMNLNTSKICQFEDGFPIGSFSNLKIVSSS